MMFLEDFLYLNFKLNNDKKNICHVQSDFWTNNSVSKLSGKGILLFHLLASSQLSLIFWKIQKKFWDRNFSLFLFSLIQNNSFFLIIILRIRFSKGHERKVAVRSANHILSFRIWRFMWIFNFEWFSCKIFFSNLIKKFVTKSFLFLLLPLLEKMYILNINVELARFAMLDSFSGRSQKIACKFGSLKQKFFQSIIFWALHC